MALDAVYPPFETLESDQRIINPSVAYPFSNFQLAADGLMPGQQSLLLNLRVRQFIFEPADVGVEFLKAFIQRSAGRRQRIDSLTGARFLGKCRLGQIVTTFVDGEFGLRLPVIGFFVESFQRPRGLFPVGDRPCRRGANLDERILHLLDHKPHDLFWIFGLIQNGIDIGIYDISEA